MPQTNNLGVSTPKPGPPRVRGSPGFIHHRYRQRTVLNSIGEQLVRIFVEQRFQELLGEKSMTIGVWQQVPPGGRFAMATLCATHQGGTGGGRVGGGGGGGNRPSDRGGKVTASSCTTQGRTRVPPRDFSYTLRVAVAVHWMHDNRVAARWRLNVGLSLLLFLSSIIIFRLMIMIQKSPHRHWKEHDKSF